MHMSSVVLNACALVSLTFAIAGSAAEPVPPVERSLGRPRIGLVLSGGGARGLAHVGVLKMLERERIPIDVIAGTSMGAIIGGLYASGMDASRLESELLAVHWDEVFASRVDRPLLTQRRKEADFELSPMLEFGMRDGELRAPLGALSGRGLETLLRRYTLPVRSVRDFSRLAIPFRAVATNLETGEPVILSGGDLALALRSSMSVPGVFAPTEADGRILGDGGLVNNLPIDVARAMGADIVIAVNIGTPLSGRDALGSVGGLTTQMISILTEQNVQRSLAMLKPDDVLITPALGVLSSSDFGKTRELIDQGEAGVRLQLQRLAPLALAPQAYAQWQAAHRQNEAQPARLAFIQIEGSKLTNPQRLLDQLESTRGEAFNDAKAERDARRLAASGDYTRADYRLVHTPDGDGLVFDIEDKPWGPHYFRVGIDLFTDFRGDSAFNIKVNHNRRWLDEAGSEWRNFVQIGETPKLLTELYHPLNWSIGLKNDWFVAGYASVERRKITYYEPDSGDEQGRFTRTSGRLGVDLGQPWGEWGEVRLGVSHVVFRNQPDLVSSNFTGPRNALTVHETGLRLSATVDQLDYVNFPLHGYRVVGEAVVGERSVSGPQGDENFTRVEFEGTGVTTWGRTTFNAHMSAKSAGGEDLSGLGRYSYNLGGFHRLSGYRYNQLAGSHVLLGRLTMYQRLKDAPLFTRGLFIGGSVEAGNAWVQARDISLSKLRSGFSGFIGADTGVGPLYLGVAYAPRGDLGLYLFLGRP
ncbi:MAG: patatin-like phospholipase family protein [Burkholderiaceae bacterium]|nr:patatin-like phospholipase family protein [Burkholderiaceae bacterium]